MCISCSKDAPRKHHVCRPSRVHFMVKRAKMGLAPAMQSQLKCSSASPLLIYRSTYH